MHNDPRSKICCVLLPLILMLRFLGVVEGVVIRQNRSPLRSAALALHYYARFRASHGADVSDDQAPRGISHVLKSLLPHFGGTV
ncbi:hypothetical protein DFS33DRAFT_1366758 [Desarmillaria ectypa]|nr:hypothetical protein DFS33DRAFT_1366758 [Desarmillaria ectypa]